MVATATVLRQAEQLFVRERSHRWLLFMYGFLMLSLTSNCRNICQPTPGVSMLAFLWAGHPETIDLAGGWGSPGRCSRQGCNPGGSCATSRTVRSEPSMCCP